MRRDVLIGWVLAFACGLLLGQYQMTMPVRNIKSLDRCNPVQNDSEWHFDRSAPSKNKVNAGEYLYTPEGQHHLAAWKLDPARLAPLTQWVQDEIYRIQHPTHCNNVVSTTGWMSGFGSELHIIGSQLAHTVENGQVLIWSHASCRMMTDRECGESRCLCFFQPLSNCSSEKATWYNAPNPQFIVPSQFKEKLRQSIPGITEVQMKYWWRAQSVAYIARLNRETLDIVRAMRMDKAMHSFSDPTRQFFPLPPGTINAHIRSGDKGGEMRLVSAAEHVQAAAIQARDSPFSYRSRTLFVSSDSEPVVQEACKEILKHEGWACVHSQITRMYGGFHFGDMFKIGSDPHHFTQQVILQIMMSMESDGWIGTRGSNWNRMLDELRCVWVDRCDRPFVEVGDHHLEYGW